MEDRIVSLYGILGLVLVGVLVLALTLIRSRRSKRKEESEQMEKDRKIQEGVEQGVLARDILTDEVYCRCVVCGGKAVAFTPMSGVSWMDKLPLLNRLFSLPPRYTIIDESGPGPSWCKIHKEVAVKKLEQFHAALRAERSQFNAQQAVKVAQMDGGGLLQIIIEQHKVGMELLEERKEKMGEVPLLPTAAPSTKRVLSTMSSSLSEEEEPARPKLEVVSGS